MKHHHHEHHCSHTHTHRPAGSSGRILAAFLLNLCFSALELVGGILTGSVAILSDALHDLGDAAGIGLSFLLEKKSARRPDESHTYGYARYSVLGGFITTVILLVGSVAVLYHAVLRLLNPTPVHYGGMMALAVVGVAVNLAAALFTRGGGSLNRRAVNLHMLEDVLGWAAVLVGAVVMRLTDWVFLDPLLSMGVAVFILVHALGNLREVADLFLEKTPHGISVKELTAHLSALDGVVSVHHVHVRSFDGTQHDATLHAVIDGDPAAVKVAIRAELSEHGISHATIEAEGVGETCPAAACLPPPAEDEDHGGHRHHHHRHTDQHQRGCRGHK